MSRTKIADTYRKMKQEALEQIPPSKRDKYIAVISNGKAYVYDKAEFMRKRKDSQVKHRAIYTKRRREKRAKALLNDPVMKEALLNEIRQEQVAKTVRN
jgi:hypothetical protein